MDKWRVTDPRGFQLEITSDNLLFILSQSNTSGLEIDEACVWVRKGNSSVALLPVSSDAYKNLVVKSTTPPSVPVKPKVPNIPFSSMKPGDEFTGASTSYNTTATYIGTFSVIAGEILSASVSDKQADIPSIKSSKYHLYMEKGKYSLVSSMKIYKIIPAPVALTDNEIRNHVNAAMVWKNQSFSMYLKGIVAISDSKRDLSLTISEKFLPIQDFLDKIKSATQIHDRDFPRCQNVFLKINNWKFIPDFYRNLNTYIESSKSAGRLSAYGGLTSMFASMHSLMSMGTYHPFYFKDIRGSLSFNPGTMLTFDRPTLISPLRADRESIEVLLNHATELKVLDIQASGVIKGKTINFNI